MFADIDMPVDRIDASGQLTWVNSAQAALLQQPAAALIGAPLEAIYGASSAALVRRHLNLAEATSGPLLLWQQTAEGTELPVLCSLVPDADGGLVVLKQPAAGAAIGLEQEIRERVEILTEMIGEATDACWCIEFLLPVDITLPEDDIVDAIFSHPQRWRACNEAMARLYQLPPDLDFNHQPVARYFPRSDVNERMIRALIRAGYRLDRAAAVDHTHDGTELMVENDFRAAIRGDRLIRLWGTVRDIGAIRQREEALAARAEAMLDVLSAAPDPILVIAADGHLLAANPAVKHLWHWPVERLLDQPLGDRLDTDLIRRIAEENGEADIAIEGAGVWRLHAAILDGTRRRFVATARRARVRGAQKAREAAE
ncbi:PAS domain-containing protein [Segnochrobactrum spirostomi]|nr:PAS domain-containing protein [Segnochrobactrum spirostomi]